MKLGDISSLGDTTEHKPEDWGSWKRDYERTLCYRDRGEVDIDSQISESEEEYLRDAKQDVPYVYLFKEGEWNMF